MKQPEQQSRNPARRLDAAKNYVVSYPKTGRTWLRMMIGRYLCEAHGLPHPVNHIRSILRAAGLPTMFAHGDASIKELKHHAELNADKTRFRDKKVLLLGRDLRDTLVSAYFHTSRRMGLFGGTLSEFIRDDVHGAVKFLTFYRHWYESRRTPREFLFLRYEDMHRDPGATLARALLFLGVADIDPRAAAAAVDYASFSNLRKAEAEDRLADDEDGTLSPGDRGDPESYKFRRGKVAGYVDYLSPEDVAYIDGMNAAMGCEFTRSNDPA